MKIFLDTADLKEIEKWNEKGFVDVDEKEEKKMRKGENTCPQCSVVTKENQKFCGECGFSLVGGKAA